MRTILLSLLLLIFLPATAWAERLTSEMADAYYESCALKDRPEKFTEKGHHALCACTASKMLENMTTEDIKDLSSSEQEVARGALNYMLVTVYAPCMGPPTKDHYYHTCKANPQSRLITKDPNTMCRCISEKVSDYVHKNGSEIFADILTRNPNIQDPMGALENDPVFQDYVKKQGIGCLF